MPYGISGGSDVARVGGRAGTSSLRVQMGESMRQYIPVITLALLGAFALAVVSGGLFPADNLVHAQNTAPELPSSPVSLRVLENTPPGTNIGAPVTATDEDGDTLTYSLEGNAAASFDIDPLTGQLLTKVALDYEIDLQRTLTVTVKATDPSNVSDTVTVLIMVDNVDELPLAPAAPTVTSGNSSVELQVHWDAPDITGQGAITGYEVQYKKATEPEFSEPEVASSPHTIRNLDAGMSYQVRVRATNADGDGAWSLVGTGMTNTADNSAPSFGSPSARINLAENTPAGQNVDAAVRATDNDSTTMVYSLEGRDADSFDIVPTSGQILTKSALNHEEKTEYTVLVKVDDGDGGSAVASRTINITNVDETPSAPGQPTVVAGEDDESTDLPADESTTSLKVTWDAPENMGPPITGSDGTSYSIQYRKGTTGDFENVSSSVDYDKRSVTIENLDPSTSYQVRVKADNDEGESGWSQTGTGSTNPANRAPAFSSVPATRSVPENTAANRNIGPQIRAQDQDGDTIEYSLGGTHAASFDINESTGQLLTKSPLNYEGECGDNNSDAVADESECNYSVTVTAEDEKGSSASKDVKIAVQDEGEPPSAPEKPTVTSVPDDEDDANGDELTTKLDVSWAEPENMGPSITSYEVQYRSGGRYLSVTDTDTIDMENRTVTITNLTANTTYLVQVRATNAESTGSWSDPGTGKDQCR